MHPESRDPQHDWLDDEAGPVVRPYTVTGGRVRPVAGAFDLLAYVLVTSAAVGAAVPTLQPEHFSIMELARRPVPVAELAARSGLAVGVVRVLLGDLLAARLIALHEPVPAPTISDDILKAVVNGLRAL